MLRVLHAVGDPYLDLLRSVPALAVSLACSNRFHRVNRPLQAARRLLGRGRNLQALATWLGFPGSLGVRLLRKVAPDCMTAKGLILMRTISNDPVLLKRASHLPLINRATARILADKTLESLITQPLLHRIAEGRCKKAQRHLLEIVRLRKELGDDPSAHRAFDTFAQIVAQHYDLELRIRMKQLVGQPMPAPPFPGTSCILPLATPQLILEEAHQQRNCLASCLQQAMEGRVAFYRVTSPLQRCTLGLIRTGNSDGWVMGDLKRERNADPSPSTLAAVQRWFTSCKHAVEASEQEARAPVTNPDLNTVHF